MYWLIGLAVVGVLGYLVVKRTESAVSALGQNMASSLATALATASVISTVTIDASTPKGDQGQFGLQPNDSLIINVYAPPPGYAWVFNGGGVATLSASTATSATFTKPTASGVVTATLAKAGATVSPLGIYKFSIALAQAAAA